MARAPPPLSFVGAQAVPTSTTVATMTARTLRRRTTNATATVASATAARLWGNPKPCWAGCEVVVTEPVPPPDGGGLLGALGGAAGAGGGGGGGGAGGAGEPAVRAGFLASAESVQRR